MRLFVYDMLVNVNVIYYVHVCEQARWARSAGNSAIENLCIIIYYYYLTCKWLWIWSVNTYTSGCCKLWHTWNCTPIICFIKGHRKQEHTNTSAFKLKIQQKQCSFLNITCKSLHPERAFSHTEAHTHAQHTHNKHAAFAAHKDL